MFIIHMMFCRYNEIDIDNIVGKIMVVEIVL